ncbi:hypothetical protein FAGKG844_50169 [Frankia sp. AgKG'84/4]
MRLPAVVIHRMDPVWSALEGGSSAVSTLWQGSECPPASRTLAVATGQERRFGSPAMPPTAVAAKATT